MESQTGVLIYGVRFSALRKCLTPGVFFFPSFFLFFSFFFFFWTMDADFLCSKTTDQPLPELEEVCTITADISGIRPSQLRGPKGPFQRYEFNFALFFEGAKMKARLEWMEGVRALFQLPFGSLIFHLQGQKKQGPVTVVPASLH
jgi:hypothetical protein